MKMKLVFAILLLVFLIFSSFIDQSMASTAPAQSSDFCGSKCAVRCGKAKEKGRCLKYCGICCQRCKCVPSGNYGNKSECPCYKNMLNSKGKSKCP